MTKQSLACVSQTTHKKHLTDNEAAEFLNLSVNTLRRWRLDGSLGRGPRWVRLSGGSSIRYPLADLEAYIANSPSGGGQLPEVR